MKPTTNQAGTFLLGGDLTINRMGFGAMRVTGPHIWGDPKNPKEARAVIRRAIELGVNFIDTADSYGPETSELLLAEVLHPYPSNLVIATKGGLVRPGPSRWTPVGRADYLIQCVEMSLRRLKLERIDLYQLHAIDRSVPLEESLGALKEMQKQGKIRHIGLSNFTVEEIKRAQKVVKIVSVQNLYNLNDRSSEDVLEYCEKNGLGFIPWYPLGSGELVNQKGALENIAKSKNATTVQIALAWLLKRSRVMLPIPGTSTVNHLEEDIAAAAIQLTDQEFAELSK